MAVEIALTLLLAGYVAAHGYVTNINVVPGGGGPIAPYPVHPLDGTGGNTPGGDGDPLRGGSVYAGDNQPGVAGNLCGSGSRDGLANTAPGTIELNAGDTVSYQWTVWSDSGPAGADTLFATRNHFGTMQLYAAKCDGACKDWKPAPEDVKWMKIAEDGYTDNWASLKMHCNNDTWSAIVPPGLSDGEYIFRHGILVMQNAVTAVGGAQDWYHCAQFKVKSQATCTPPTESIGVFPTPFGLNAQAPAAPGQTWAYGNCGCGYKPPGPGVWDPDASCNNQPQPTAPPCDKCTTKPTDFKPYTTCTTSPTGAHFGALPLTAGGGAATGSDHRGDGNYPAEDNLIPSPSISGTQTVWVTTIRHKKQQHSSLIPIIAGCAGGALLLMLLVCCICYRKRSSGAVAAEQRDNMLKAAVISKLKGDDKSMRSSDAASQATAPPPYSAARSVSSGSMAKRGCPAAYPAASAYSSSLAGGDNPYAASSYAGSAHSYSGQSAAPAQSMAAASQQAWWNRWWPNHQAAASHYAASEAYQSHKAAGSRFAASEAYRAGSSFRNADSRFGDRDGSFSNGSRHSASRSETTRQGSQSRLGASYQGSAGTVYAAASEVGGNEEDSASIYDYQSRGRTNARSQSHSSRAGFSTAQSVNAPSSRRSESRAGHSYWA